MSAIDAYIASLDKTLRGPKAAKIDLITEARDSLIDAAEAYQRRGLDRAGAESRAVAEFGGLAEIAPGYQAELGLSQARQTAFLVLVVHLIQQTVSEQLWRSHAQHWDGQPAPLYAFFADLVDWLGLATMVASLLAMLACGIGVRYLGSDRRLTRAIGLYALVTTIFFVIAGVLLTAFSHIAKPLILDTTVLLWAPIFWAMPAGIIISARRCLRAA